ncbi:RNA 3'-terminal phosphate cyclase [Methanofollis fontis]|uniref:RNA 3'-terminal phosphate cyclase n=2 Tax=Methanofollis fontis TaxID=2052832 RepID=A0A483CRM8_9EURY|nr:RNA 3'-terminal phosphate cyclase [Methanofollis fontis]
MLVIDGSYGEGGGQVVRTAVAIAALTGTPIEIERIRAGRDRPGLAAQHCTAVRAVALACGAEMMGCSTGSGTLTFRPGEIGRTEIVLDIGTAGSIPLVLQAWLPVALVQGGRITLTGGTEVQRSPTIDYIIHVLLPVLTGHGAAIDIEVRGRGYYPQGGGEVQVTAEASTIAPLDLSGLPDTRGILSCSQNLPEHVAERQARAAAACLPGYEATIERREGRSTGTSVTVWNRAKGACALGRRGLPAEQVGRMAAEELRAALNTPGETDIHLADQLLVYLALSGGRYSAPAASSHALTACHLLERFGLSVRIEKGTPAVFSA